jgi:hypothetical protein
MGVQMEHHLSASSVDIDNKSIPGFSDAEIFGNASGDLPQMFKDVVVGWYVVQSRNVLPRHNQNVQRGSRISIPEGYNQVIGINMFRRPPAFNYVAENALRIGSAHMFRPVPQTALNLTERFRRARRAVPLPQDAAPKPIVGARRAVPGEATCSEQDLYYRNSESGAP